GSFRRLGQCARCARWFDVLLADGGFSGGLLRVPPETLRSRLAFALRRRLDAARRRQDGVDRAAFRDAPPASPPAARTQVRTSLRLCGIRWQETCQCLGRLKSGFSLTRLFAPSFLSPGQLDASPSSPAANCILDGAVPPQWREFLALAHLPPCQNIAGT